MSSSAQSLDLDLDRALHFASKRLQESGHNPKPVLLHSAKTALCLYNLDYSRDIVVAAVLHDLIEDTDTVAADIENAFSPAIAGIVEACTFSPDIEDDLDQARDMLERCAAYGNDALIVKCADLLDNIGYVHLAPEERQLQLRAKYALFLTIAQSRIGNEPIYEMLAARVEEFSFRDTVRS